MSYYLIIFTKGHTAIKELTRFTTMLRWGVDLDGTFFHNDVISIDFWCCPTTKKLASEECEGSCVEAS